MTNIMVGWRRWLPLAGLAIVGTNVIRWGGLPAVPTLQWATGFGVLGLLISVFGLVTWWLYFSPLPAGARVVATSSSDRVWASRFILIAGFLFGIAALWDEVWHRLYGVSAVIKDFLWPPHVLLYTSLAIIALVALWGVVWAPLRRGAGRDLRVHFRADPALGGLGLLAGFQALSLPMDAMWHQLYGLDITAWSVPHLLIINSLALVLFANAAVLITNPVESGAGEKWRLEPSLALLSLMCGLTIFIQGATAEWEGLRGIDRTLDMTNRYRAAFWQRPDWLYPAVVTAAAVFTLTLALHLTRRYGAATFLAVFVLCFRITFLGILGGTGARVQMGFLPHLVLVPVGIGLDLLYTLTRRRWLETTIGQWLIAGGVGSGIALAVGLPLISRTMVYPVVNASTLPLMVIWSLVCGIGASWFGITLGGWLRRMAEAQQTLAPVQFPAQANRLSSRVLVLGLFVVAAFIGFAQPPI